MPNKQFLQYLTQKLKSGNRASIHLNALPSNYVTRLDVSRLEVLTEDSGKCIFNDNKSEQNICNTFLENLLTKSSFKQEINFWDLSLKQNSEDAQNQLKFLAKRLDSIYYQTVDNYLEYGIKTFGFGYPLLIKRDRNDAKKIIKAPLLIWQLEIEKSKQFPNSWIIKKEDDFPIAVNEILISQIYSDDNILIDAIPPEYIEDSVIQQDELLNLCNSVLNEINRTNNANEAISIKLCPSSQKINELADKKAYIQWSGIFGTYKNQKQSIIRELESLAENFENFEQTKNIKLEFGSKLSGVETDPSQERIITKFADDNVKVIQGPPGTGKSQTLSAIITNALENQKKCLVICEKKTAIEVIFNNLDKIGIGSLCAVIDDINKDRERIIKLARSKITFEKPDKFPEHLYQRSLEKYEFLKKNINQKLAQYTKACFGDFNHKELTGLYLENWLLAVDNKIDSEIDPTPYQFNYYEYEDLLALIKKSIKISENARAYQSGLNLIKDEILAAFPNEKIKQEYFEVLLEFEILTKKAQKASGRYIELANEEYDKKAFLQNLGSSTLSLFNKKVAAIHRQKKEIWKAYINLSFKFQYIDFLNIELPQYQSFKLFSEVDKFLNKLHDNVTKCIADFPDFWKFQEWKRYFYSNSEMHQQLISVLLKLPSDKKEAAFKSWYFNESLKKIFYKQQLEPVYDDLQEYVKLKEDLRPLQQKKISNYWHQQQQVAILEFQKQTGNIKRLYNYRKNKEFGRKNALRKIINADFDLFSGFFPVILTNPVACSSVLPMKNNLFDIVIFDEASQLRIEDTYTAYLRGAYKVISGDRHQMPPSSYFQSGQAISLDSGNEEEFEESAFLAESESLLEFAEENTIKQTLLEFHYRSRHPYLIDFSNAAFYGNRLIPMPAVLNYKPIHFKHLEGIYKDGVNIIEAEAVVDLLASQVEANERGQMPSVGIATTNLYQRNLIWDKISERAFKDQEFSRKISQLNANNFFVKNLENIQGDERDIIIISTTFGLDEEGNFRQNFGPLNQANGYRLLNVIITRAKKKMFVCTSIPGAIFSNYSQLIEEKGNNGRGIFYAYLAYVQAIELENENARKNILSFLSAHCKEANTGKNNSRLSSPFEQSIAKYLSKNIDEDRIRLNYQFGGFSIDMAILSKIQETKNIALECNGTENFEIDEAYCHLHYRKKILELYGFDYQYLWSLEFWQNTRESFEKLLENTKI